ncbi:SRPBCC family protein [Candidatus Nitrososphaera sp. FF02]|uniref:SRPBCC family protein n=1 Tax=Candidatus Nitrososphaera sp. FF02 TaxID=3398226 RepID=UPI0039EAC3A9
MRRFVHDFTVEADIEKVWDFYTGIGHLAIITPPEMNVKVVRCTSGDRIKEGAEVWLEGTLVLKSHWHSKITHMKPYTYVDEMLEGRFRVWKHVHRFERTEDGTKVIDEIDFEPRYGLLGRMLEGYAHSQLEKIFAHRKEMTIRALR